MRNLPRGLQVAAFVFGGFMSALTLHAVDGQWIATEYASWGTATNWKDGSIASGADAIATFTNPNVTNTVVNLGGAWTVGTLKFTNPDGANKGKSWALKWGRLILSTTTGAPTIEVAGGLNIEIEPTISGSQGFRKTGTGYLTITGNNDYTGVTTLSSGYIYLKHANGLGASGVGNETVIDQAGAFPQLHISNNIAVAESFTIRNSSTNTAIYSDSGNNSITGGITLERSTSGTGALTYGVQVSAGSFSVSGDITGRLGSTASANTANTLEVTVRNNSRMDISSVISDGGFTTQGLTFQTSYRNNGIVSLSGASTYSGKTIHKTGVLLVNNTTGSGTGYGAVVIDRPADAAADSLPTTLGGIGIIAPRGANGVTIGAAAIVAPGNLDSAGAITGAGEKLTFNLRDTTGKVTFASGAIINLDANAATGLIDNIAFTGLNVDVADVIFNDNAVNLSSLTGGILSDGLYILASFDAANAYSGKLVLGSGFAGLDAKLVHTATSIMLQIGEVPIPEPATYAVILAIVGLGVTLIIRRRR